MPGCQNALSCIARQGEPHRVRNIDYVASKRRFLLPVPLLQVISGPVQRFVQVTEIACIWASSGEIICHAWAADVMAPNGFQYAISGVWHVAVVALASAGHRAVMGVGGCS